MSKLTEDVDADGLLSLCSMKSITVLEFDGLCWKLTFELEIDEQSESRKLILRST